MPNYGRLESCLSFTFPSANAVLPFLALPLTGTCDAPSQEPALAARWPPSRGQPTPPLTRHPSRGDLLTLFDATKKLVAEDKDAAVYGQMKS